VFWCLRLRLSLAPSACAFHLRRPAPGVGPCRNIKHAFFQPAENEMITLVHFHLIDPIMVGKKKTQDVQFYTEVMESVQTLDVGRRNAHDVDELDEEQRERDMRNKVTQENRSPSRAWTVPAVLLASPTRSSASATFGELTNERGVAHCVGRFLY
jgi:hypothetical protein